MKFFSLYTLAFSLLVAPAAAQFGFFSQWNPSCLPNVAVLILPDRIEVDSRLGDGGTVTNAPDGYTTNKLQQTTSARRPTYKLHNVKGGNAIGAGHNSIRFNGTSQTMYVTNVTLNTDTTSFLVLSNTTAAGILWEHGTNANNDPGEYGNASSTAMWFANRGGTVHWAVGVTSYMNNKLVDWDMLYPAAGDATVATNGTALANGAITGSNLGNSSVGPKVLSFMGRNDSSSWSGGDVWFFCLVNAALSADDLSRCRDWERRVFHTF